MKLLLKSSLAFILAFAMITTGCSASWISVAVADLPVLVQIATSILGIVAAAQGKGAVDPAMAAQVQSVGKEVQTDLQNLQALVDAYKAAPAASKPAVLADIQKGLGALQGQLSSVLSAFHVKDAALQATIAGAVGLALSTVLAIQSLLPPTPAAKALAPVKPLSASQLKAAYNHNVQANGYGAFAIK
jgi:hypothetical protein